MSSLSNLSDSVVLRETKFSKPDDKGRVQLQFTLPSGRLVTSTDWLVPGEIKGRVLIAWANAIRAEDSADINEREERAALGHVAQKARELLSAAPGASGVSAPKPSSATPSTGSAGTSAETSRDSFAKSSELPDDPGEIIASKIRALLTAQSEAEGQLSAAQTRLDSVRASIARWATVAASLGLDLKSLETPQESANEVPDALVDRSPGPDSIGDRNPGGFPHDVPSRRRRTPRAARQARSQKRPVQGAAVQQPDGVHAEQPDDRSDSPSGDSFGN